MKRLLGLRWLSGGLLGILFSLSACNLRPGEGLSWEADVLAPIAYSEVNVFNILQDSGWAEAGADGLIEVVFRDTITSTSLSDLVIFPDTVVQLSARLDSLSLDSDTLSQRVTLGQLARQLAASGNAAGTLILANHGNTLPFIPAATGLSSGAIPVDASSFFEFALLESGILSLTIRNELPLGLSNVIFEIKNTTLPGPPLVRDTFPVIPKQAQVTQTYDLSGREVESALQGELVNVDIQAGIFVPIDTTDYLEVKLQAQNMRAVTATAVFPAQDLLDTLRRTRFEFEDEFADVALTRLKIRSGKIKATAVSTIGESVDFFYQLPFASNGTGVLPGVAFRIAPAPEGGSVTQVEETSLAGYTLDLTSGGIDISTFVEQIRMSLVYSGNLVTLDQTDSLVVTFGLTDIVPAYAEGYLGRDTFTVRGSESFTAFKNLDVSRLQLGRAQAQVQIANTAGVDARVEVRELTASNARTGESVRLTGTPFLAGPFYVAAAELPDTLSPVVTTIDFTQQNSNILRFVNVLPESLQYDIRVFSNPTGQLGVYRDFATDQSRIAAYLEVRIPLEGVLEQLTLTDTVTLDWDPDTDVSALGSGTLRLLVDNRFPVQAAVTAVIRDASGNEITRMADGQVVQAGVPNAAGYVEVPVRTVLEKSFEGDLLSRVIRDGRSLTLRYTLDSRPAGSLVKFYTDYTLLARLVGEFKVSVP
ncbi:MAG: hypothetical protein SF053_10040 [Bacteroidia bacterium]|nr:hypothetical protein [Bacteroidia bacterium]